VVNASISGETTSGGASRISATLAQHRPRVTILAWAPTTACADCPVGQMRDNLAAIIRAAQKAGGRVLLLA